MGLNKTTCYFKGGCSEPRLPYSALCRRHANEKAGEWYKTPQGQAQLYKSNLRVRYNTTPEEVAATIRQQEGRCAICRELMDPPQIDHDHAAKRFRGMLCRRCNQGLGRFQDNVELLQAAIDYLMRHNGS